jgi:hypothetical protein
MQEGIAQDGTITQRMRGNRNYDRCRTGLILAFAAFMESSVKQMIMHSMSSYAFKRVGTRPF